MSVREIVRQRAAVGTADYTVAGTSYWSNSQIDDVLARNRRLVVEEPIEWIRQTAPDGGASYALAEFYSLAGMIEPGGPGTAGTMIDPSTGGTITGWTIDQTGLVTFAADTGGTVVPRFTGYVYDVNGAAAEVLETYAAHVADQDDFSTDDQSFSRSQKHPMLLAQAARLRERSAGFGVTETIPSYRDDLNPSWR